MRSLEEIAEDIVWGECPHGEPVRGNCEECVLAALREAGDAAREGALEEVARMVDYDESVPAAFAARIRALASLPSPSPAPAPHAHNCASVIGGAGACDCRAPGPAPDSERCPEHGCALATRAVAYCPECLDRQRRLTQELIDEADRLIDKASRPVPRHEGEVPRG